MDPNAFFRQGTLRICGNLEIEEALQDLLFLMRGVMPVTRLYLQYYDTDYAAMRTIAYADDTECRKLDLLTPLSDAAKARAGNPPAEQDAFLIDDPKAFPVSREMAKFHSLESTSVIVLILRLRGRTLGYLVLITEAAHKFNEAHLELALLLKEPLVIATSNALKHREVLKLNELLADDNQYLHGELRRLSGEEIVGANYGLRDVMQKVRQVASLDSPVLLMGETGTGKDVIANAIHYSSTRSGGPFVSVNCGAIPDTLIDSELFGHEKGAFTGALSQKRGRFERAHQGTIFLDEIGELPPPAQVRLLRVLQSREIERVGGVKTIPLDIRILAATNRDLEKMVGEDKFREDLWFRLNVFPIRVPPLRERIEDLPTLVQHFVTLKSRELKLTSVPTLSPGALDAMMAYHWPGNVRELQNVIERALILNPKGPLTREHFTIVPATDVLVAPRPAGSSDNLDAVITRHIQQVLAAAGGKINGADGAAGRLGVNPSTLRNKMKKLGIAYGRKAGR
ncbi:MAG: sigma-54 dependent transcriptional regulator [Desulfosarcinaceae bacterium]|nr:sigma-54 dependent transcriptional regulator [Desulfosarcinaceae bacterium]